jgi:Ca2+-binding EF-hand superfamily protein
MWDQHQEDHHMIREISKIVVGAGLLSMLLGYGARGDDKGLPGPIDSVEDLQDAGKMLFKLADTNNDNLISQKEAIDAGNLLFGGFFFRADTNGDGKLTPDELRAAREALFNQKPLLRFIFQRTSAEVDRQGSQAAVNSEKQKLINLLDTNHDSTLSAVELRQAVQSSVQSLFLMADVNNDGQLEPAEVNGAIVELGRTALQTAFNAADVDKNGALSQAEFDKAILNPVHVLFRNLDANNDNQISADEMRSGMEILIRELKATRVPGPPNSISNQLRPQGTAAASSTQPTTSVPAQPVQAAPTVAPTPVVPPQR